MSGAQSTRVERPETERPEAERPELVPMALRFLRSDGVDEPFYFVRAAPEAMALILDALFESGASPRPPLMELVAFAEVLDHERHSPTAADVIRRAISADRRALAVLGVSTESTRAEAQKARTLIGAHAGGAPLDGGKAPAGSFKASSIIDPLAVDRLASRRARR